MMKRIRHLNIKSKLYSTSNCITRKDHDEICIDEFCCLFYGYKTRCLTCPLPRSVQDLFEKGHMDGFRKFGKRTSWEKFQYQQTSSNNLTHSSYNESMILMGLDPELGSLSVTQIRTAFRSQAFKLHPDSGGTTKAFQELVAAYEYLLMYVKSRRSMS